LKLLPNNISMRKLFVSTIACCIFMGTLLETKAQDPQYSQFYANLVLLNPAFTGSGIGHRVAMNYRGQWVNIPGHYRQFAFSYDVPVQFLGSTNGLGINFNSDVAGEGNLRKLHATLNYAYQVDITDDHILRFGLRGGIMQASLDFFKLRFPDQINPTQGFTEPTQEPGSAAGLNNQIRADVGAGVAYFNRAAYVGVTLDHITQPEERFYDIPLAAGIDARLPMKLTATAGVKIPLSPSRRNRSSNDVSITPAVLYKLQGEFSQLDLGLYVNVEPMVFGVWYRNQDAVIGLIGIQTGNFRFGYSYDFTVSNLGQRVSGGSHEVSVVFEIEKRRRSRRNTPRDLPCPKF